MRGIGALVGLIGVWLTLTIGGLAALTRYAGTPGAAARAPATWPDGDGVARAADRPSLLFFVHPACPCTRASVSELGRLMARVGGRVAVRALVSVPEGAPPDWTDTDVVRDLAAIQGVRVLLDQGDREAARFGVATSGQALLYDVAGRLRFRGGLTGARGHAGDNACRDALERLIQDEPAPRDAPVFGCALITPVGEGEPWSPR